MTTTALKNRSMFRYPKESTTLARTWAVLCLWRERARERARLAEISAQMLADIGVSRAAARAEAGKPFWLA
jgi:uncharacterized protein YjiS (DUF1127 family)